jgi:hypothetical protein
MKHLTKSTKWMIGSLTFAVALTSLAQNTSGQERLLTQNDVANKLQQYSVESEGVSIRPADASLVWSAAEQFKGKNVSLDLPKSGDALASNSVLIGSGSDGLVSDNNLEKKGTQYILNPPLTPKTSITLVGRPGGHYFDPYSHRIEQSHRYCGVNLLYGRYICTKLNIPLRVQQGTYLINYMGMSLKVSIKENENKIVYLREILVPKQIKPIGYQLKMHRSDSNQISGIIKTMNRGVVPYCSSRSAQATYDPEILPKSSKVFITDNSCEYFLTSIANESINHREFYNAFYDSITFVTGIDNSFVSVLPGVYNVEWTIDEQKVTTELKID